MTSDGITHDVVPPQYAASPRYGDAIDPQSHADPLQKPAPPPHPGRRVCFPSERIRHQSKISAALIVVARDNVERGWARHFSGSPVKIMPERL